MCVFISMSDYLVILSRENLSLAKAEFFARFPFVILEKDEREKLYVSGKVSSEPLALTDKIIHHNHTIFLNTEQWTSRKMRGATGLSPKLARAMVNLTGVSRDTLIVDPFCGRGGILREAALLGHPVLGYDTDPEALAHAQKTIPPTFLLCRDACTLCEGVPAVVTDLPYGKNTSVSHLISLYSHFLHTIHPLLQKTMVIGFPHFVSGRALLEQAGFHVLGFYRWRLHYSLTKEIFVVTTQSPISALKCNAVGTSKIETAEHFGE